MSVVSHRGGYLVTVYHKKARGGRVRIQHNGTRHSAVQKEADIRSAFENYGMWPVEDGAELLKDAPARKGRNGTLSQATQLALATHWKGTSWGERVEQVIWLLVDFMERERGKKDLDDILSDDLDAFTEWRVSLGNEARTVNHYLSMLSVIYDVAMDRTPPLAAVKPNIKKLKVAKQKKWWMRPEDYEKALDWLHNERLDPEFADFISIIILQGLRIREANALEVDQFVGLGGDRPSILPPGTKTDSSQNAIPVFDSAVELITRCIERADRHRRKRLFVYTNKQLFERWNELREYLGASDNPTATMKSLRRTFAYYAHRKNLSTRLIQKILRHTDIKTTTGYLDVVGDDDVDLARDLMNRADLQKVTKEEVKETTSRSELAELIAAYKEAGASPKEIAEFIKEMRS